MTRTTFDANGRVDTLTYPSGYAVKQRYTGWAGQPDQLSELNGSMVHWQANSRYNDGQINGMLVGGLSTTKAYDALGRVASIATSGASATIQGASYSFDLIGNLTHRYDAAAGQADQYYGYDRLNRLTAAAATAAGLATGGIAQYDAAGNFIWKSGAGYYSYVPGTHRLCAIGAAANPACDSSKYQYDGNGNAALWSGRMLGYTPFNAPAQIVDPAGGATLGYQHDASHARIREVSSVSGTTYYLGAYEEHTRKTDNVLEQRHYLNTPEGIVGVATLRYAPANQPALPPDQARSLGYWHKDHLGSVVAITNETGALKQTFTYDPWGNRTNPGLATGEPYAEERGYTGHEHLTEVRLIHMNGRVYDPVAGRMLQADPVVQDATSSQNYNRYAYVLNNPLTLIDPTGFSWWTRWRGAVVGVAIAIVAPYAMLAYAGAACGTTAFVTIGSNGMYALSATGAMTTGAAAGFAAGGIQGGNVESALWGAFSGAVGAGVGYAFADADPFIQKGVGSVVSGGVNVARGGTFRDGATPHALSYVLGVFIDQVTPDLELYQVEKTGGTSQIDRILSDTKAFVNGIKNSLEEAVRNGSDIIFGRGDPRVFTLIYNPSEGFLRTVSKPFRTIW